MEFKKEAALGGKGRIILLPIFMVLAIIGFILAFNTGAEAGKYKKLFEKEMAFRLDMEEKVNNFRNEKMSLTTALQDKDQEIEKLKSAVATKENDITKLQSDLDQMTLLKNKLEENLKEELAKKATAQ
ncbi:MAG: hypothetical protein PHS93_01660 [Candidatus Omnitrophica bacterium]|nr:hypothetical protein [Candidatus Omnitrophota bacterium]MDD5351858.1 hypothetical protein [Candidatus Omnitrophota bacterium]MDD5550684.1 hypothetical protein [Candidatus Omnitrophota bacterium]